MSSTLCWRRLTVSVALGLLLALAGCGQQGTANPLSSDPLLSYAVAKSDPLALYPLAGEVHPILDPSVIRQGNTWYVFGTDVKAASRASDLDIRCSTDSTVWKRCGSVFTGIPQWVKEAVPGVKALWAPDISFFNGEYHLYYAASLPGKQRSVIGLATNRTLDPDDPAYHWTDNGMVLESHEGDDFNAIDPNILVDTDGRVYLTFGSYWSGIKQIAIEPSTGQPLQSAQRVNLAARPQTTGHAIEGASLIRHGNFYYLFLSIDHCCETSLSKVNYKQAVGRSKSPEGPFLAQDGKSMLDGASTVLLRGNEEWAGPGGGSAYEDPLSGKSILVFHSLRVSEQGAQYVWFKSLNWIKGWPEVQ